MKRNACDSLDSENAKKRQSVNAESTSNALEPEKPVEMQQYVKRIKLDRVCKFFLAKDIRKWLMKVEDIANEPWIENVKIKKAPKSFTCLLTFSVFTYFLSFTMGFKYIFKGEQPQLKLEHIVRVGC
jgi:hypothetical protein